MRKIPPQLSPSPLSDELYDQLMSMAKKNQGPGAAPWIHIADAVSRGTISPMEAYDSIRLGYCPEHLKIRESDYYYRL